MTLKRTSTALVAIAAGIALLAGCSPTNGPQPTKSSSPTPTSTSAGPVDPPKSEDEAVKAAEVVLTDWLDTRGTINAAGGKDATALNKLATGKALDLSVNEAKHWANGPILNVDKKNVPGGGHTEGKLAYEPKSAYGQDFEGTPNGLVTVNACQDGSAYKGFASDGTEAMLAPEKRTLVDYQVVYDVKAKAWLVSDVVGLNQPC